LITSIIHYSLRIGPSQFNLVEVLLLVVAVVVISWTGWRLWHVGRSEDRQSRIDALRGTVARREEPVVVVAPKAPSLYDRLGAFVAASSVVGARERANLNQKLSSAGFKSRGRLGTFVGFKVCAAVVLGIAAYVVVQQQDYDPITVLIVVLIALTIGWRLPDFVLNRISSARKLRIEGGMPDALDLLVICAEAGLNLEQAIEEISRDLRPLSPDVAEELATTASEMRILPDRSQALDNLGRRTGIAALHSLTATLNQSIKFGTPLAESLRVLAAEMRNMRLSRFEERAARLPVLLTMPLMIFIMPSLFIVILTPLGLRIYDGMLPIFMGSGGPPPG
jgi:tight adherence protein C